MKRILYLLIFLATGSQAQTTISGKVTDTKGEALIGVNMAIKNSYDGATTNAQGEYSFETSEKDSVILTATYIGFVSQEKKILLNQKNIQVNFAIKEKINDLKAVVISAGAFEASDEKKGTVLKPLDIVTTAGSNGDNYGALKTLPGAQQTNDREGLFVRGGTGSETQTFIDGTWVRNAFSASIPDLGARGRFNPFIFKGTVFSTGGYSALYGQALSSAVILETIDLPDRSSANLNISSVGIGGSVQKLSKNKKQSWGLGYNHTNLTPYFALVKQNIDYKLAPTVNQIDLNYRIKTSKSGILKFYGYYNHTGINIQRDNITSIDYGQSDKAYQDEFGIKNNNVYANLAYKDYFKKDWKLNIGFCFSDNQDKIETKVLDPNDQVVSDSNFLHTEWLKINSHNQIATTKVVLEKGLNNLNTLRFGAEYIFNRDQILAVPVLLQPFVAFKPTLITDHYKALFAESDIYITNDLAGKIGVRAEHSSLINRVNIAPRVSAAYKLNRAGQISAAYGLFYQKPEVTYLYRNTGLNYMRADHYILNYLYQPKDRLLRIEAFYKKYHGLIKTNNPYAVGNVDNNGQGYARGIELFYRDKKSIKGIDFWISYSFLDTKRNFLNYLSLVQPDFAANHTGSFVFKKFWTKYMFGINGTYTYSSGRPYINYNQSNPNDPGADASLFMSDRTISFHNFSLSANYLKNIGKAFTVFVLSVNNPFGFKQVYGYNYAAKDLNGDGTLYRREITPTARQFIFLGMFMSWGIDRTQEAIDNNL
ncbi:MAG: TonB-dependent receptor [Chitinophagaceae bacterium]|nr:TonB-dependent receptor [Chitinophagaceae bacterium]